MWVKKEDFSIAEGRIIPPFSFFKAQNRMKNVCFLGVEVDNGLFFKSPILPLEGKTGIKCRDVYDIDIYIFIATCIFCCFLIKCIQIYIMRCA